MTMGNFDTTRETFTIYLQTSKLHLYDHVNAKDFAQCQYMIFESDGYRLHIRRNFGEEQEFKKI